MLYLCISCSVLVAFFNWHHHYLNGIIHLLNCLSYICLLYFIWYDLFALWSPFSGKGFLRHNSWCFQSYQRVLHKGTHTQLSRLECFYFCLGISLDILMGCTWLSFPLFHPWPGNPHSMWAENMLLVADLAITKWCKNPLKMTETLAHGYSSDSTQRVLSNECRHDRVKMIFKNLCILVLWIKSSLSIGRDKMAGLVVWDICLILSC